MKQNYGWVFTANGHTHKEKVISRLCEKQASGATAKFAKDGSNGIDQEQKCVIMMETKRVSVARRKSLSNRHTERKTRHQRLWWRRFARNIALNRQSISQVCCGTNGCSSRMRCVMKIAAAHRTRRTHTQCALNVFNCRHSVNEEEKK